MVVGVHIAALVDDAVCEGNRNKCGSSSLVKINPIAMCSSVNTLSLDFWAGDEHLAAFKLISVFSVKRKVD